MAAAGFAESSSINTRSPATTPSTPSWAPGLKSSSSHLMSVPEDGGAPPGSPAAEARTLRVVSLNLGGRNTNPVEFELKGDNSEMAVEAMTILRNAGKAMKSAKEGPLLMPPSEMQVVQDILERIFMDSADDLQREWQGRIRNLLRCETWAQVLSSVRFTSPHLFNAFNLYTLKLNRPSVWESPDSCKDFTNTKQYLLAWKQWYLELDRAGRFWAEDAPRVAKKRGLDVPTAFAGLLLFDVMCLCTARRSMPSSSDKDDDLDGIADDTRDVPFREIARFAAKLPASSLTARHELAQKIAEGAHALLTQEARSFADHPTVAEDFLPPFCALDGFTAIFLRKDSFNEATDITAAVVKRMEQSVDAKASSELQRAWRTTVSRLAAVFCKCHPRLGRFRVCLVSLHVSKSEYTGDFVEKLRDVLADYDADINVVGMDSNCAAREVAAFRKRLVNAGFDIGCTPKQQQVTVAKQRTAFQTQTQKVGEVDISHKDYILTWTSPRVRRGQTTYTPDLRTSYGVDQETKQCVRLPTTDWPFDHCSVATSFQQRFAVKDGAHCKQHCCRAGVVLAIILFVLLSPLVSTLSGDRSSPYGEPGLWFHHRFMTSPRYGICETVAPCPDQWLQSGDSCYVTTPRMGYPDVERFCQKFGGAPVTIESEAENQLMLRSLCPSGDFCYIGLLGDFSGRSYWSSGAALNYTQLVQTQTSVLPIWENSRSTTYVVTLLSNMPGEVTGCDARYSFTFHGGEAKFVDVARELVAPVFAMACSGLLLSLRRPPGQRLASSLLLMAFCMNAVWAAQKTLNACFVDDFFIHLSVAIFGKYLMSAGVTASSTLGLWMIVRRLRVLYPSRVFKQLFWASIGVASVFFLLTSVFIDATSPMAPTWAVLISTSSTVCNSMIYLVFACLTFRHLHRTWECLRKEATSGCSTRGRDLAAQVRSAKLHLIAVPLAVLTGASRWASLALIMVGFMQPSLMILTMIENIFVFFILVDSVTNDFCAHVLAVLDMDRAVVRAKGVTTEAAERVEREVEQHRLAVRMLKAAPTSVEQLQQLAILESKALAAVGSEQEVSAFLILQSAVRVETARIHQLMHCVRTRAMTMRIRYQFLTEVPALEGAPRQHVPEAFTTGDQSEAKADKYFEWLYSEAPGAQQVLFQQMQDLLAKFNRAVWPSDLGLAPEEFPWRIWAGSNNHKGGMKRLQKNDVISPGDTLVHSPPRGSCLSRALSALCIALEEVPSGHALIHRSGMESPQQVPRADLRTCNGGAVFIPGPQKKRQRSLGKIATDYGDSAAWPAAASLVDVCRCMLLCDDPYAMAVLVAYLRKSADVVRVKNRFGEDVVEPRAAEELQSMFYSASASDAAALSESQTTTSSVTNNHPNRQYRDISMNCVIMTPSGVPFVCEVQVTLANLAILKHADQKLYTIRRMKTAAELSGARTFVEDGGDGGAGGGGGGATAKAAEGGRRGSSS